MRRTLQLLLCSTILFLLTSCTVEEETTLSSSAYAIVICSGATDCSDSSADAKQFTMAFFNDTNCASYVGAFDDGFLKGTMTCAAGTCTGTNSSNFVNEVDTTVAVPAAGLYSIFTFIDTNNNNTPDSGEPSVCSDNVTWDGVTVAISLTTDEP